MPEAADVRVLITDWVAAPAQPDEAVHRVRLRSIMQGPVQRLTRAQLDDLAAGLGATPARGFRGSDIGVMVLIEQWARRRRAAGLAAG